MIWERLLIIHDHDVCTCICTHNRGLLGHLAIFETFSVSKLVGSGPSLETWFLDFVQGIVLLMMLGMKSKLGSRLYYRIKFVFKMFELYFFKNQAIKLYSFSKKI